MTLDEFYQQPARAWSPEVDFGVWWYAGPRRGTPWRVSWVERTGELYAVRLGHPATVEVFGEIVPRAAIDRLLEGWAERCGQPASLGWIRARMNAGI